MSYKLDNLQSFHAEMKKLNVSIATFDFTYNEVSCACLFEADYEKGFSLTFFKTISGESLKLPVLPGYRLNTYIEDPDFYRYFWNFFQLNKRDGGFTMSSFFENLNRKIPQHFSIENNLDRPLLAKQYDTEEKDRPYFLGFINWQILRAKNPKVKGSRSDVNLKKTEILYPQIYKATKNYDISVRYTAIDNPNIKNFTNLLKDSFHDN